MKNFFKSVFCHIGIWFARLGPKVASRLAKNEIYFKEGNVEITLKESDDAKNREYLINSITVLCREYCKLGGARDDALDAVTRCLPAQRTAAAKSRKTRKSTKQKAAKKEPVMLPKKEAEHADVEK